jgi:hypothetical protein
MATVTGTKRHLAIDSDTLNTGQGANELYDMDQNVLTTSGPTFASVAITNNITVGGTVDGRDVAADGAKAVTAHGWGNHASAGYATGDNFDNDGTFASLRAQGTTKGDVGLGNVTNESKATMFASPTLTGTTVAPTPSRNDSSTKIATTAYVQAELTDLIGTAPSTLDTLGELSASLAADQSGLASLTTTVGTKLAKASNLSDLANAGTARTNLGLGTAATSATGDFAAASHNHAASDITSGTFGASRIPNLAASKITTGTLATGRISEASVTQHEGALTITEAQISDLGTYSTATGVSNNADVTPSWVPSSNPNYLTSLPSHNHDDRYYTETESDNRYLLDSEVTNLAEVKAFDSSDYATAAQGGKADTAHGWGNHASAGYGTSNLALGTTSTTALAGNTTTISSGQASAITANTAKTGITSGQASAITANTAKTGITSGQASAITANTAKTGITSAQASAITANSAKRGISSDEQSAIAANTAKTGITSGQASAITANTAKTGITSGQASAITANTSKRDARYIYFPVIANFSGNINTQQYIPLSDGETEGTSITGRRDNFVAPCAGEIVKVIMRSNASLYDRGRGVTLTGKLHNVTDRNSAVQSTATATTTTAATNFKNILDFSEQEGRSFAEGDRLLVSLQAPLNATKNYYVTVVFKLDQNDID